VNIKWDFTTLGKTLSIGTIKTNMQWWPRKEKNHETKYDTRNGLKLFCRAFSFLSLI